MQHHPVVTYLRLFGFAIGALMFIFMVYRSGQMVDNPIYVKGKPFLQQIASNGREYPGLLGVTFGSVALQPTTTHRVTKATEGAPPSKPGNITAASVHLAEFEVAGSTPAVHPPPISQPDPANHGGNVPQGKALGVTKQNH